MKKLFVVLMVVSAVAQAEEKKPTSLTLEYAKKIVAKAETYAAKKNWKLSIAITNSEGNLVYFQRDPEAYAGSIDAAIQKAVSSAKFQRPTAAFVDRIKTGGPGALSLPGVVAIEGGVPILIGGKNVGAIGVSGAKALEDEETAKAALE